MNDEPCGDRRLPYSAMQSEGQHACVVGPNDEIIVECVDGSPDLQAIMAGSIARHLNDLDDNHCCNDQSHRERAHLFLLIVARNHLVDRAAMDMVSDAVDEINIKHVRDMVLNLGPHELPF